MNCSCLKNRLKQFWESDEDNAIIKGDGNPDDYYVLYKRS